MREPLSKTEYGIRTRGAKYTCERCRDKIFSDDYMYHQHVLCATCYDEVASLYAVVEYIRENPDRFIDYLRECDISDNSTKVEAETLRLFRDWEDWDGSYSEWAVKNDV